MLNERLKGANINLLIVVQLKKCFEFPMAGKGKWEGVLGLIWGRKGVSLALGVFFVTGCVAPSFQLLEWGAGQVGPWLVQKLI